MRETQNEMGYQLSDVPPLPFCLRLAEQSLLISQILVSPLGERG